MKRMSTRRQALAAYGALLAASPRVVSSIMGLFPETFVAELKSIVPQQTQA